MKCRECAEGRKYAEGSVFCIQYGMIVRADHECIRDGSRMREREEKALPEEAPEHEWDAINEIEGI